MKYGFIILLTVFVLMCVLLLGPWGTLVPAIGSAAILRATVRRKAEVSPVVVADEQEDKQLEMVFEKDLPGSSWVDQPTKRKPFLKTPFILLLVLLSGTDLSYAQPVEVADCVPYETYGDLAAGAGYGLWSEDGDLFWCRCLAREEYRELTRLAQGCTAEQATIAYTVEADLSVRSDLFRASEAIRLLLEQRDTAREQRNKVQEALTDLADKSLVLASKQEETELSLADARHQAQELRGQWFTPRSIILSLAAGLVVGTAVYVGVSR